MLYVSFPSHPKAYPSNCNWWSQITHFVYNGLKSTYKNVEFINFNAIKPMGEKDILITFVPHAMMEKTKRVITVDNCSFDADKWNYGEFRKYGLHEPIDNHKHIYDHYLDGVLGTIFLSNDVAIEKWNNNDPEIMEKKTWYTSHIKDTFVMLHPIDKDLFSRGFNIEMFPADTRMLIYHAGQRKNSQQLIDLMTRLGYKNFDVVGHVDKQKKNLILSMLNQYHIIANCSYSETGPINMIEYMIQGFLVYGHEDWWSGYGDKRFCWSYDPARIDEMAENIKFIMDKNNLEYIKDLRLKIWSYNMNRRDNEWALTLAKLKEMIDKNL